MSSALYAVVAISLGAALGALSRWGLGLGLNHLFPLMPAGTLVANLLGFSIPGWLEPATTKIGAASLALGLMAAGAGLQPGRLRGDKVLSVALLSIRHLWLPLLAWLLARLFGLDPAQTTILLIFSAMPTASSCYVLATRMGYDGAYTAGLVTLSTMLGMVSLPFVLGVLRQL